MITTLKPVAPTESMKALHRARFSGTVTRAFVGKIWNFKLSRWEDIPMQEDFRPSMEAMG